MPVFEGDAVVASQLEFIVFHCDSGHLTWLSGVVFSLVCCIVPYDWC